VRLSQLIVLMAVRKLLDYVFTQSDLYWLDHLLPDEQRRAKEDERSQLDDDDDDDDGEVHTAALALIEAVSHVCLFYVIFLLI
jgi:hypothetical protein